MFPVDFTTDIPPRMGNARTDWVAVVAECKKNRGQYGLVGEYSVSVASQIRQGVIAAFLPKGADSMSEDEKRRWMKDHWQVEYRRIDGKPATRANVYVRYVG